MSRWWPTPSSSSSSLTGADLVITGEGQIDGQSSYGKTIMGVAARAKGLNIPVIALAGSLAPEYRSIYEQSVLLRL